MRMSDRGVGDELRSARRMKKGPWSSRDHGAIAPDGHGGRMSVARPAGPGGRWPRDRRTTRPNERTGSTRPRSFARVFRRSHDAHPRAGLRPHDPQELHVDSRGKPRPHVLSRPWAPSTWRSCSRGEEVCNQSRWREMIGRGDGEDDVRLPDRGRLRFLRRGAARTMPAPRHRPPRYCHAPAVSIFITSSIAACSSRSTPRSSSSGVFSIHTSGATP